MSRLEKLGLVTLIWALTAALSVPHSNHGLIFLGLVTSTTFVLWKGDRNE